MRRSPRLLLAVFERTGAAERQSPSRDQLAYYDPATGRQQRSYDIVREQHALTVYVVDRWKSALSDSLLQVSNFIAGKIGRGSTLRTPPSVKA